MAQSITEREPLSLIRERFSFEEPDLREYSPLGMAFLGDAIYEMVIRTIVFHEAHVDAGRLAKRTEFFVNARSQSEIVKLLLDDLTEEEKMIFRRGRNAKPGSVPRHQSVADYNRATGLEVLCGYLYLNGRWERLIELIQLGIDRLLEKEEEHA